MSLSQTYRIASTARGKLGAEASRGDHNLRLLVGHANLLDTLMLDLANAEREEEAWFNNTIRSDSRGESTKHIQWFDNIAEEEEDDSSSDSDSDSDVEIDVADFALPPRRRSVSPPPPAPLYADDVDIEDYYDEDEELTLTRVSSHSTPELVHEDSESDDEPMSPPLEPSLIDFDQKTAVVISQTELFSKTRSHLDIEVVPHQFTQQTPTMIEAY